MALGKDPLGWIDDTKEVKPEKRQSVNTAKSESVNTSKKILKKVTYYIEPELDKALKILAAEEEKTISELANEAVKTFLQQNAKK